MNTGTATHATTIGTSTPVATADTVTAHTLLNCLVREVSAPEHQATIDDDHLLLRLPRRGILLRSPLRRVSLIGAHRFRGAVQRLDNDAWVTVSWKELAGYIQDELQLRTGVANEEFLSQVADSRETIRSALEERAGASPHPDPYVASEQSLVLGHRFHPTPKSRTGDPADWLAYGPEAGARFRLRYLAVRRHLVCEEGELREMDALCPASDPGFAMLPVHPWQYRLLQGHDRLQEAVAAGDVVDTGVSGPELVPTASVRTLYDPDSDSFLKFSLNVRLTN
ncbi:IucA/IucC family protein, partial [Streptomyces sp. NPDC001215]